MFKKSLPIFNSTSKNKYNIIKLKEFVTKIDIKKKNQSLIRLGLIVIVLK